MLFRSSASIQTHKTKEIRKETTLKKGKLCYSDLSKTKHTDNGKLLFERTTNLHFQTEKQKDLSEAKVLFPDFFPQGALQDIWEAESPWKARPVMEQIFSGQNNLDFPVKSEVRYDTYFEYWKTYQLSF